MTIGQIIGYTLDVAAIASAGGMYLLYQHTRSQLNTARDAAEDAAADANNARRYAEEAYRTSMDAEHARADMLYQLNNVTKELEASHRREAATGAAIRQLQRQTGAELAGLAARYDVITGMIDDSANTEKGRAAVRMGRLKSDLDEIEEQAKPVRVWYNRISALMDVASGRTERLPEGGETP